MPLGLGHVTEIALLAAHCDDLAIGMGGTLLTLAAAQPDLTVRALVLTGGGTEREVEERTALTSLVGSFELTVHDLPDGRTPAHYDAVKDAVRDFASTSSAQVVFGPQRRDAHQDHRLLAEIAPTEFRNHLMLGYEILKWETDTPQPTAFVPLSDRTAEQKVQILMDSYPSQHLHDWYEPSSFLALSRLRGIQCRAPHAEAFVVDKWLIDLGGHA
ncbi:PIG-L deacetylase family protein [Aeromicrobium sp. CF3.5]|uniref:PIG-L deacetylase family protein n=1 Tax=Aeromicrobium sp. CF3.5 TaxID=3373078 RepID=UPI003EE6BF4B